MANYFAGEETFTVCGVYKDFVGPMMPSSDNLSKPEYDASYSSGRMNPFSTLGQYVTLIKVQEGTDREALTKKVEEICKENYHGNFVKSAPIYTMPELYFNPQQWFFHRGNKSVLQMLLVVVLREGLYGAGGHCGCHRHSSCRLDGRKVSEPLCVQD